jgi:hypothetical protein
MANDGGVGEKKVLFVGFKFLHIAVSSHYEPDKVFLAIINS